MRNFTFIRRQHGLSLIELLVGLGLGAVVSAMIGTVFVQGQQSFRAQKALNNMNDDAGFVLDVVVDSIAHAGYAGLDGLVNSSIVPTVLEDGASKNVTSDGGDNDSDEITIVYRADLHGTQTVNCLGAAPTTQTTTIVNPTTLTPYEEVYIFNQYYIKNIDPASGLGTLVCNTWQSRAVDDTATVVVESQYSLVIDGGQQEEELVRNVAAFEVLYGVDTTVAQTVAPSGTKVVSVIDMDAYIPWEQVDTDIHIVRAVRLGVAFATEDNVRDKERTITLSVLNKNEAVDVVSRRQYIMYEKNIELKNTPGQIREL